MFKEITLEIAGKRIYLILDKIAYKNRQMGVSEILEIFQSIKQ